MHLAAHRRTSRSPLDWTSAVLSQARVIDLTLNTCGLFKSQLLAAPLWQCSWPTKVVMNELERRFLKLHFVAFISAVLLLNGAERITGLNVDDDGHLVPTLGITA